MSRHRLLALASASLLLPPLLIAASGAASADAPPYGVDHIVVIYEENHSFDNLYGGWGDVNGQHADGLFHPDSEQTTQGGQGGAPLSGPPPNHVEPNPPPPPPTRPT